MAFLPQQQLVTFILKKPFFTCACSWRSCRLINCLWFRCNYQPRYKARTFFSEAKVEGRKVVWPTRAETRQTTLIVIAVTVLTSLFFWAIDSIIIALINFLTDLRF